MSATTIAGEGRGALGTAVELAVGMNTPGQRGVAPVVEIKVRDDGPYKVTGVPCGSWTRTGRPSTSAGRSALSCLCRCGRSRRPSRSATPPTGDRFSCARAQRGRSRRARHLGWGDAPPHSVHVCSLRPGRGAGTGAAPGCGGWNTLVEERAPERGRAPPVGRGPRRPRRSSAARGARERDAAAVHRHRRARPRAGRRPRARLARPLGGSPRIGKSTLTNDGARHVAARPAPTLYVSGEESAAQIRLRAERLAGEGSRGARRAGAGRDDLDAGAGHAGGRAARRVRGGLVQTLAGEPAAPRAAWARSARSPRGSSRSPRRKGTAVLLVGHVTKEGALAGPRVLEHLVDCVLQFEGERERTYRTLRAHKNRFGSTNDVGVFEMREGGLVEVLDASARFVAEATRAPGQRRPGLDGGLAAAAGRGPGARLAVRARAAAAGLHRLRPQPPRARPRGPRPPRGRGRRRRRRLRQRRRRRAHRRARRRPGVRSRWPARRGACVCGGDEAPVACFGEVGLTGELRSVAHPSGAWPRRPSSASPGGHSPRRGPALALRRCAARGGVGWCASL